MSWRSNNNLILTNLSIEMLSYLDYNNRIVTTRIPMFDIYKRNIKNNLVSLGIGLEFLFSKNPIDKKLKMVKLIFSILGSIVEHTYYYVTKKYEG